MVPTGQTFSLLLTHSLFSEHGLTHFKVVEDPEDHLNLEPIGQSILTPRRSIPQGELSPFGQAVHVLLPGGAY